MEESHSQMSLLALVAVVAVVGIVSLVMFSSHGSAPGPIMYATPNSAANTVGGQAYYGGGVMLTDSNGATSGEGQSYKLDCGNGKSVTVSGSSCSSKTPRYSPGVVQVWCFEGDGIAQGGCRDGEPYCVRDGGGTGPTGPGCSVN